MARSFFIGVGWTSVAIVSGLAAMISYSEAGRLSGGSKVLAGAGAVVLAVAALFTLVKGRIAIREARRIAMRGSMSRRTEQLDHFPELEMPGLARDGSGPLGPIRQLNDAQEALARMRPVCRTSEALSSVAKRFDLRLEPAFAFFADGEGALVEASATGIGIVFFAPHGGSETTLFVSDHTTWDEIEHEVHVLAITRPEWLAESSEFPD